jgi:hypothetical protein
LLLPLNFVNFLLEKHGGKTNASYIPAYLPSGTTSSPNT